MHDSADSFPASTPLVEPHPAGSVGVTFTISGFAAFALVGGLQALYGPLIPSFRTTFHLNAGSAGLILSAHYVGAVVSIIAAALLERRMGDRRQIIAALLSLAVGCLALAAAPIWPVALVGALCIGAGYGTLVVRYNSLFASSFGARSAAMLTLVNAGFGAGALLGPLIVGALLGGAFRVPYLAGGLLALAILPLVRAVPTVAGREDFAVLPAERSTRMLLLAFVAMFFLYVGLETDVSGWEATQLVFHGYSHAAAATFTAVFWGVFTLGRLLVAPLTLRISPPRMVLGALLATILFALMAQLHPVTPAAYAFLGLALAPIFPVCFVWLGNTFPQVRVAASAALLAALLGGAVFPTVVGGLIALTSPDALPTALATIALVFILLVVGLMRVPRVSNHGGVGDPVAGDISR